MLKCFTSAQFIPAFLKDECGQDAVEYAIMIGICAVAAIASVGTIANFAQNTFGNYSTSL